MDETFICDNCDCETTEEFSHASFHGTLCMDCYEKTWFEHEFNRGKAWIQERLPTIEQLAVEWGVHVKLGPGRKPKEMEGNCHSAAVTLKKMLLCREPDMVVKVKRGHWLGSDLRSGSALRCSSQHSWLEIHVPDDGVLFYVDPTQWVFLNQEPSIAITDSDDQKYDAASHRLRKFLHGLHGMSGLPERVEADLIETKLGPEAQKAIARRFGTRDWSHWTRAECFEIANEAPSAYGEHAREIYDALSACDFRALIPFTSKEEVYNDGNHD